MKGRFVCGEFACPLSSRPWAALVFDDADQLVAAERFRSQRAMRRWCEQVLPVMESVDSAPVLSVPRWLTSEGMDAARALLGMARRVSSGFSVSPGSATVH